MRFVINVCKVVIVKANLSKDIVAGLYDAVRTISDDLWERFSNKWSLLLLPIMEENCKKVRVLFDFLYSSFIPWDSVSYKH